MKVDAQGRPVQVTRQLTSLEAAEAFVRDNPPPPYTDAQILLIRRIFATDRQRAIAA